MTIKSSQPPSFNAAVIFLGAVASSNFPVSSTSSHSYGDPPICMDASRFFSSDGLKRFHHVDKSGTLEFGPALQVDRGALENLLDVGRMPLELFAHRQKRGDRTGDVGRSHA